MAESERNSASLSALQLGIRTLRLQNVSRRQNRRGGFAHPLPRHRCVLVHRQCLIRSGQSHRSVTWVSHIESAMLVAVSSRLGY